jgi:plasmanylethanolamine desaturase
MRDSDSPALDNSSGRRMRLFETACLVTAVGLVAAHAVRFAQAPELPAWAAVLAVALGLPAADFLSGFIHWAGDTWGRVTTRWVGPRLLVPFRYHHLHPRDMLRSPFVTTNGDAAMVACLVLGAALLIPVDSFGFAAVFVVATGAWGLPTSQIHKWAHDPRPPRVVRWLQGAGLILSPENHRRHHRTRLGPHYCITTGWCNPVLERLRFWKVLEWVVSRVANVQPRNDVDVKPVGRATWNDGQRPDQL